MRSERAFGWKERPSASLGRLNPTVFVVVIVLALRLAGDVGANASYLVLAGWALVGRPQVVQAFFLSWLITMLNPGIAQPGSLGAAGRFLVVFAGALSVIVHVGFARVARLPAAFGLATLTLGLLIIGHSLLFSPMRDVSILKVLGWMMAMGALIAAWDGMSPKERAETERFVFGGLIAIMLVSLPLLVSNLGYLVNASGFQGVLNHPQVLGVTMALLAAWAAGRFLGMRKPAWTLLASGGACLALIALSEARTGGVALIAAMLLAVAAIWCLSGRSLTAAIPGLLSRRFWYAFLLGGALLAPLSGQIAGFVEHFLAKSGRSDAATLAKAFEQSRGFLVDQMLENIRERPITGIGFGIASEPDFMLVLRDPVFDLPVGAAVEKGVMPLAVLEELGVPGSIAVGLWLSCLLLAAARGGLAPLAVALTALLINMGESVLFSPGGQGLLILILLSWAWSSGLRKFRRAG